MTLYIKQHANNDWVCKFNDIPLLQVLWTKKELRKMGRENMDESGGQVRMGRCQIRSTKFE